MPYEPGRLARMLACVDGHCHQDILPASRPGRRHPSGSSQRRPVAESYKHACYGEAMRAITVIPGQQGSVALADMPEPPAEDGPIVVQTQAIGICGTDLEIINGEYGSAPPGQDRLIIGHESLGRVAEAAPGTGFRPGDLVVGIVRRRDPVPCPACAAGHWDMCTNGQYTERGSGSGRRSSPPSRPRSPTPPRPRAACGRRWSTRSTNSAAQSASPSCPAPPGPGWSWPISAATTSPAPLPWGP